MREDNNKQQMESQRHSTKYMNNTHDRYFNAAGRKDCLL